MSVKFENYIKGRFKTLAHGAVIHRKDLLKVVWDDKEELEKAKKSCNEFFNLAKDKNNLVIEKQSIISAALIMIKTMHRQPCTHEQILGWLVEYADNEENHDDLTKAYDIVNKRKITMAKELIIDVSISPKNMDAVLNKSRHYAAEIILDTVQNCRKAKLIILPEDVPATLTKDELIQDAITHNLVTSKDPKEAEKEYRCHECPEEKTCKYAWDHYNIGDDGCLAEK